MNDNSVDGFEMYRRERERRRLLGTNERRPLAATGEALRQLEAVEAREERDRRLTEEVHDFFETATRTAADIVHKVAESAKLRIDEQLGEEMRDFLLDSMARMQGLVSAVLSTNTGSKAEEVVEPLMHNLVGQVLDGFRRAGTAAEQHLGQDPLATDLDDVRREFQAQLPGALPETEADIELDDTLPRDPAMAISPVVARAAELPRESSERVLDADQEEEKGEEETGQGSGYEHEHREEAHGRADADADEPELSREQQIHRDLKRFKHALETLVRQGNMTKAEARAAWDARKASLRG